MNCAKEGETLRVDAGADYHVSVTAELGDRLQRWLITAVEERARELEQGTATELVAVAHAVEY